MFLRALAVLLLALAFAAPGRAETMYHIRDGIAVSGYDTVAYFTLGRAVPGRPDIEVEWKGALWRFASLQNRETFEANPRAYAPQYGGHCAYAMSLGHLLQADPQAWRIVDGRLYLTHDRRYLRIWSDDIAGNIRRAAANWPAVLLQ